MIKMIATVGDQRTLFLGLERKNTDKLHEQKPIIVNIKELGHDFDAEPIQQIVIWAGETLEDAYSELKKNVPDLPPYQDEMDIRRIN